MNNKKSLEENLTLVKLNALISNCPGKADLRFRENKDNTPGMFDVYWTNNTGLKATYFVLTPEDVGSDIIDDRVYVRYYIIKETTSGKKSVHFDLSLSTEYKRSDLEKIYETVMEILDDVGVGEYSITDLNAAVNKNYFTEKEAKRVLDSILECHKPVCFCLPCMLPEISTEEECNSFIESGEIDNYLPNQLMFKKTEDKYEYYYINGDSGVYYLVSGKNEDGTGTDLQETSIMERIHMYQMRLKCILQLTKGKDEYARGIIDHLPAF